MIQLQKQKKTSARLSISFLQLWFAKKLHDLRGQRFARKKGILSSNTRNCAARVDIVWTWSSTNVRIEAVDKNFKHRLARQHWRKWRMTRHTDQDSGNVMGPIEPFGDALRRKGCCSSWRAVALEAGSRTSIPSKKPLSMGEAWKRRERSTRVSNKDIQRKRQHFWCIKRTGDFLGSTLLAKVQNHSKRETPLCNLLKIHCATLKQTTFNYKCLFYYLPITVLHSAHTNNSLYEDF